MSPEQIAEIKESIMNLIRESADCNLQMDFGDKISDEDGTDSYMRELTADFMSSMSTNNADLHSAWVRINDDPVAFAQCTKCRNGIGIPRLTYIPTARMCITCQERHELNTAHKNNYRATSAFEEELVNDEVPESPLEIIHK